MAFIPKDLSKDQSSPKVDLELCLMDLSKVVNGIAHVSSNSTSVSILQAPYRCHLLYLSL